MAIQELSIMLLDDDEAISPEQIEEEYRMAPPSHYKIVPTTVPNIVFHLTEWTHTKTFLVYVILKGKPRGVVHFVKESKFQPAVYSPHATLFPELQKQGIVSSIFSWFLDDGHNLLAEFQTYAGFKLWQSLSSKYKTLWFDKLTQKYIEKPTVKDKKIEEVCSILLGPGQPVPKWNR